MDEEIESPAEHIREELPHSAAHNAEQWLKWSALFVALFAVLATIAGLKSSHYANDAMLKQIALINGIVQLRHQHNVVSELYILTTLETCKYGRYN